VQAITKTEQTDLQRARGTIDLVIKNGKLERFYQSGSAKIFSNQKTMAIVLVEQYFDFAFGLADQIYAVKRGEVVYESKKSTIDKSKLRTSVGV